MSGPCCFGSDYHCPLSTARCPRRWPFPTDACPRDLAHLHPPSTVFAPDAAHRRGEPASALHATLTPKPQRPCVCVCACACCSRSTKAPPPEAWRRRCVSSAPTSNTLQRHPPVALLHRAHAVWKCEQVLRSATVPQSEAADCFIPRAPEPRAATACWLSPSAAHLPTAHPLPASSRRIALGVALPAHQPARQSVSPAVNTQSRRRPAPCHPSCRTARLPWSLHPRRRFRSHLRPPGAFPPSHRSAPPRF